MGEGSGHRSAGSAALRGSDEQAPMTMALRGIAQGAKCSALSLLCCARHVPVVCTDMQLISLDPTLLLLPTPLQGDVRKVLDALRTIVTRALSEAFRKEFAR